MIGSNHLKLCQSEMNKALDFYLRGVVFREDYDFEVETVSYSNTDCCFTVKLAEPSDGPLNEEEDHA